MMEKEKYSYLLNKRKKYADYRFIGEPKINKWHKNKYNDEQLKVIYYLAGDEMKRLGYVY